MVGKVQTAARASAVGSDSIRVYTAELRALLRAVKPVVTTAKPVKLIIGDRWVGIKAGEVLVTVPATSPLPGSDLVCCPLPGKGRVVDLAVRVERLTSQGHRVAAVLNRAVTTVVWSTGRLAAPQDPALPVTVARTLRDRLAAMTPVGMMAASELRTVSAGWRFGASYSPKQSRWLSGYGLLGFTPQGGVWGAAWGHQLDMFAVACSPACSEPIDVVLTSNQVVPVHRGAARYQPTTSGTIRVDGNPVHTVEAGSQLTFPDGVTIVTLPTESGLHRQYPYALNVEAASAAQPTRQAMGDTWALAGSAWHSACQHVTSGPGGQPLTAATPVAVVFTRTTVGLSVSGMARPHTTSVLTQTRRGALQLRGTIPARFIRQHLRVHPALRDRQVGLVTVGQTQLRYLAIATKTPDGARYITSWRS